MLKKLVYIIAIALMLAGTVSLPALAATTHSISGTVTLSGAGLKGVKVTVQGTAFSAVTDGLGNYHIASLPAGTGGTLVPSLVNYTFAPVNIKFSALAANLTGKNFTATLVNKAFFSIAGTVTKGGKALAGVTVDFSTFSAVTNSLGAYKISNIPPGTSARIIPLLAGYGFTPKSIAVSNLSSNLVNQNFTAAVVFTISGIIKDKATGLPLGGVTVKLGTLSAVTNAVTGAYNLQNIPAGTSGLLTPSKAGKTFTPPTITVTNLQASMHSKDFVAVP